MFGNLLKKAGLGGALNKLSGKTDVLEAGVAAGMLISIADGEIEDEEVGELLTQLQNHPTIGTAFSATEIERVVNAFASRAKGGVTGRMGLWKEIDDIASDAEKGEMCLLIAIDVSRSDGEMEPAEMKVLEKIASRLRLNLRQYLEA
jgi:tellurite resistance protein